MTFPVIVLWLLIVAAAFIEGPLILYLFCASAVFGDLTMLPPAVTGGANLLPQSVCAVVLVLKLLLRPGRLAAALRLALDLRGLGFLTLFWLYGVLSSVFLPRLLANSVLLFPLNDNLRGLQPLLPTAANLSQAVYLTLSFGVALAFAVAGRDGAFRAHFARAVLLTALLLVASGVADLTLNAAGLPALLKPFHNAGYSLLTDVDLGGQKRVVGFMPEASSYGGATCAAAAFLVFGYTALRPGSRTIVLPLAIVATVVMVVLSTSSSGYVGLIVLAILAAGRAIFGSFLGRQRSPRGLLAVGLALAAVLGGCLAAELFAPGMVARYANLIDITLVEKTASSSYAERSSWTAAGLAAFQTSGGIGVGVGSVRTSNWYVNILASTGLVGAVLAGLFVLKMLAGCLRGAGPARPFVAAMLLAILPSAVLIGLAGTTPDPGVWIMSIVGLIAGAARSLPIHRRQALAVIPL